VVLGGKGEQAVHRGEFKEVKVGLRELPTCRRGPEKRGYLASERQAQKQQTGGGRKGGRGPEKDVLPRAGSRNPIRQERERRA